MAFKFKHQNFEAFSLNAGNKPLASPQILVVDPPYSDPLNYRSLVGSLNYLIFTHPEIAFAVHHVCQYMHAPRESHFLAVKHILCYL